MSGRRSRFKVAANIPVRRKNVGSQAVGDDVLPVKTEYGTTDVLANSTLSALDENSLAPVLKNERDDFVCANIAANDISCRANSQTFSSISSNDVALKIEVGKQDTHNSSDTRASLVSNTNDCIQNSPLQESNQFIDRMKVSVKDIPEKGVFKRIRPQVNFPLRRPPNKTKVIIPELRVNEELRTKNIENSLPVSAPETAIVEINHEVTAEKDNNKESIAPAVSVKLSSRARFIKPSLTEAGVRRYSVHASSASESEDDTRRQLQQSKIRGKPENQELSAADLSQQHLPPSCPSVEPYDESAECVRLSFLPKKKAKVSSFVRKVAEARRDFKQRFSVQKPDRSKLKMFDLLFYNPSNSPLKTSKMQEKVAVEDISNKLEEENVDNPDDIETEDDCNNEAPVPQVKIGVNGEIIIDEKSLVIETTASKKSRRALENAVPYIEDRHRKYAYYGKHRRNSKEWTPIETKCFYKALNCLGTDFALMQGVFPERTRAELKSKFKREEKCNGVLIDKALSKPGQFNIQMLQQEIDDERNRVKGERQRQLEISELEKRSVRLDKAKIKAELISRTKSIKLLKELAGDKTESQGARSERPRRVPRRHYFYDDCGESSENHVNVVKTEENDASSPIIKGANSDEDVSKSTKKENPSRSKKLCRAGKTGMEEKVDSEENISSYPVEDIHSDDIIELLKENISKTGKARIEIKPPSPSSRKRQIQVLIDSNLKKKQKIFRVESNVLVKAAKSTGQNDEGNVTINEERRCVVDSDHDYSCRQSEVATDQTETETVYTFPSISCDSPANVTEEVSEEIVYEYVLEDGHTFQNPSHVTEPRVYRNLTPASSQATYSCETSLAHLSDHSKHSKFSQQYVIDNDPNECSYSNYNNITGNNDMETSNLTEVKQEFVSNTGVENNAGSAIYISQNRVSMGEDLSTASQSNSSSSHSMEVNYRMTGGLQYAVIESGTTLEQKRTYLAGLRPGSFVFMSTEAPNVPLEHRCSMYMIAESVSLNGEKEFKPMPVVLPPELMHLIMDGLREH